MDNSRNQIFSLKNQVDFNNILPINDKKMQRLNYINQ